METLTFTCKIITPMFLAGADGKTPELRAASIKGALRFWWRAMQREPDHKVLRAKEDSIFGGVGSGKEGKAQRSKVMLQILTENGCRHGEEAMQRLPYHKAITRHRGKLEEINILEYLAYGVSGRGSSGRPYFANGSKFRVIVRFHPLLSSAHKEEVINGLRLLGRYGGLGAKSRNGFGSFSIDYDGELKWCHSIFDGNGPSLSIGGRVDYTALSKDAKLFETKLHPTWHAALATIGQSYRGEYPIPPQSSGGTGRLGLDKLHEGYTRKYIAMPLNNGARHSKSDVHERRPKSLFLGVSKIKSQYKGHILYLPDTYQHNGTSEQAKHDKAYAELIKNFSSLTPVSLYP